MKGHAILPGNPGHHGVQIYTDDTTFVESIADFLADGLAASQPTLVIATPLHCELIVGELSARRFDVPALLASGSILLLDARETIDVVILNGRPEPKRFREAVGLALDRVARSSGEHVVRVYDELVDVLWRDGNIDGALKLEELWNGLLKTHQFSLLCGYAMSAFVAHPAYAHVCAQHTHVHNVATV